MPYTVPNFNLTCDVWNAGNIPSSGPADFTGVACQFYIYSRHSTDVQPCELELYTPVVQIRMPVAAGGPWVSGQVFEVESGSGRYYRARWKDRVHYGFPNEYLVAIVVQCNEDGVPLIRDIEGAVPCVGSSAHDGEADELWDIAITCTGEGTVVGGGGGDAEGMALLEMEFNLDVVGTGTAGP